MPLEYAIHPCNAFRGSSHQLKTPPSISALGHPPPLPQEPAIQRIPTTKVQLVVRLVVWKPQPKGVLATTTDERAAVFVATRTLAKILQNTAKRQTISTARQKGYTTYLAQGQGQAKWWLCGALVCSTSVVWQGSVVVHRGGGEAGTVPLSCHWHQVAPSSPLLSLPC